MVSSKKTFKVNDPYDVNRICCSLESGKEIDGNYVTPFRVGCLQNFAKVSDDAFFKQLRSELDHYGDYSRKDSDLFSYWQAGAELQESCKPNIRKAVDFLLSSARPWLSKLLGLELNDKLTLTSSIYETGDYLLCHDDEVKDRKVAFIWYIMDDWAEDCGGLLQTFETDESGQPTSIARSFVPAENTFAFFPITRNSYHCVSEVVKKDARRVTLNGWFHGDPNTDPADLNNSHSNTLSLPIPLKPTKVDEEELFSWINPVYIDPSTQAQVQADFGQESEIQLSDFFLPDKYDKVLAELKASAEDVWKRVPGPHKQNYERFSPSSMETYAKYPNVSECLRILRSEAMFLILSQLTGLKLHPLVADDSSECNGTTETDKPCCSSSATEPDAKRQKMENNSTRNSPSSTAAEGDGGGECSLTCLGGLTKWKPGDYSLVHDDSASGESALDLQIDFCSDEWYEDFGGYTVYLDKEDGNELIRVVPQNNSLSLVYREPGVVSFRKYLNKSRNPDANWLCNFSFSYFE